MAISVRANFDISWMDEVLPGFDNLMPSASGIKGAQTFPNATKNPRKKGLIWEVLSHYCLLKNPTIKAFIFCGVSGKRGIEGGVLAP